MKNPNQYLVSQAYEGNYLAAGDLLGHGDIEVTIERYAQAGTVKDARKQIIAKPILYFTKAKKGLILGATNAKRIRDFYGYGDNMAGWIGQKITLTTEMRNRPDAGGRKGPAVAVKIPDTVRQMLAPPPVAKTIPPDWPKEQEGPILTEQEQDDIANL